MENEKKIIKKINDIYVSLRKKFLIMNNDGYKTIQYTDKKRINLSDVYVARHLQKKETIGLFAGNVFTKFICFDVDVHDTQMAKIVVYKLVDTLQNLGIPGNDIHISLSGSKGYHVEIFFNDVIKNDIVKRFFDTVTETAELTDNDLKGIGKVELRPTATQGVKIPLGKHFKSGKTCWYCDFEKSLRPIKSYDYILNINQIETSIIDRILDSTENIHFTEREAIDIEYIHDNYKPQKSYYENINEIATIEAVQKLIKEGLTVKGTRHNSLLKICKYYKYCGMTESENEESLIQWLQSQNKQYYTTTWDRCLKDIKEIVEWVYNKNALLTVNQAITISDYEMKQILKVKGKNKKLLLFALLVHKKRYANKNGVFFMAFSTMTTVTGLTEKTVITLVKKLEVEKVIDVIRSKEKRLVRGEWRQDTNNYLLSIDESTLDDSLVYEFLIDSSIDYKDRFKDCVKFLFKQEELKRMLTRREYDALVA